MLAIGQRVEIFIEKLSFNGGRGVGRHEGMVVFVEGAAPQELLTVAITKLHKKFAEAKIIEIKTPSPSRRTAPCPVYGICGGCSLQHIDYPTQISQKSIILEEQLRSLKKLQDFEIRSFVPSDDEFYYRNRVQFHIQDGKVGFFKRGSHEIVNTEKCYLVEEQINRQIPNLKNSKESRVEARSHNSLGANFFSQVNSSQNLKLQNKILELVEQFPDLEVWDLYGGAGNFSIPLAQKFSERNIVCVEGSREAVSFGKKQALELGLKNITWIASPVEDFLEKQKPALRLILLDPPRVGLSEQARKFLKPQIESGAKIIYLSCNPSAFARDAQEILFSGKLRLEWVQGFDLFPQTDHIEMLSLFN